MKDFSAFASCKIIGHTSENCIKYESVTQDHDRKNQPSNGRNKAVIKKAYVPKVSVMDNGQSNDPPNDQSLPRELIISNTATSKNQDKGKGILDGENGLFEQDTIISSVEEVFDKNAFIGVNNAPIPQKGNSSINPILGFQNQLNEVVNVDDTAKEIKNNELHRMEEGNQSESLDEIISVHSL